MSDPAAPVALTTHLVLLSSISFGGFPSVLPDVCNFVVFVHPWMTDREFLARRGTASSTKIARHCWK